VTWVTGGDHRSGMLVTGVFFVMGWILLLRVDVARGQSERQSAEAKIDAVAVRHK